jgi:hypothetical protein
MGLFDGSDSWLGTAISVGGSMLTGYLDSDDEDQEFRPQDKILPKTTSGTDVSNFDVMYSAEAVDALKTLSGQLDDWSKMDRDFFENTFLPYQQTLVQANLEMAGTIEKVAGATLEQNLRDMVSNDLLKNSSRLLALETAKEDARLGGASKQFFEQLAKQQGTNLADTSIDSLFAEIGDLPSAENMKQAAASTQFGVEAAKLPGMSNMMIDAQSSQFFGELDKLPSTEQAVGEAMTQVESQFTGIGKELARDFASRGQAVSQASKRDLLIEKAKAKSGAARSAEAQNRAERLSGFQAGVGVATGVAAGESQRQQARVEAYAKQFNISTAEAASQLERQQAKVGAATTGAGVATQREAQKLEQLGAGVDVAAGVRSSDLEAETVAQAGRAGATANLIGLQTAQQAGLATTQIGGVEKTTGLEAAELTSGLVSTEASKTQGTRASNQQAQFTQEGIQEPVFAEIETKSDLPAPGAGSQGQPSPGASAIEEPFSEEENARRPGPFGGVL